MDMTKKAIALIRTSTDRQQVEDQRKEVLEMAKAEGWSEDQIIVVGGVGASAIKVDEAYQANMQRVYDLIDEGNISAVYAWSVDRIGRDRLQLAKFRIKLTENKIQLVIKNPFPVRLLDDNGEENQAISMLFSINTENAIFEMKDRQAKFRRAKRGNAENGRFNGGKYVLFGYDLNETNHYILHADNAPIVRLAFELMASGKFSISGVCKEFRERGIKIYGSLPTDKFFSKLFKNTSYIGYNTGKSGLKRVYPKIISNELFEKVQDVLANNNTTISKAQKHYNFASLLIKCPECGRHFVRKKEKYACSHHVASSMKIKVGEKCSNSLAISVAQLDGLLWYVSTYRHYNYLKSMNDEKRAEIVEKILILKDKISEAENVLEGISIRQDKLDERYFSKGDMTEKRYDDLCASIMKDKEKTQNVILKYNEEISSLESLLNPSISDWLKNNDAIEEILKTEDEKMMYDIVHLHVSSVDLKRVKIADDVEGICGKKAVEIKIKYVLGDEQTFYYLPKIWNKELKIFSINGTKSEGVLYEPIIREESGKATTLSVKLRNCFRREIEKRLEGLNDTESMIAKKLIFDSLAQLTSYDETDPLQKAYMDIKSNSSYLKLMSKPWNIVSF